MRMKKDRKHWSAKRLWKEYLKEMPEKIELNGQRTIDNVLAAILMNRTGELNGKSGERKQQVIDDFGKKLSTGRLAAINDLITSGIELNICGGQRIHRISKDPADRDEHNERLARQLDCKKIGVGKKVHHITPKMREIFGLPSISEVTCSRQRLLLGDAQAGVVVKNW